MIKYIVFIALGGAVGSVFRFLLSKLITSSVNSHFPYGTFIVNIIGCFIIGFLVALFAHRFPEKQLIRQALIAGFCGGLTTFSSFANESFSLLKGNNYLVAGLYIVLSVVVGLLGVALGGKLIG